MARTVACKECGETKPNHCKGLCKGCYMAVYNRERYLENPDWRRGEMLRSKYGITLAEYDEVLEAQANECIICGLTPEENGKRLCVDHDHATGKVRGLLCDNCNRGIGNFQDNPESLVKAAEYLLEMKETHAF